jgi:hypothetical protein
MGEKSGVPYVIGERRREQTSRGEQPPILAHARAFGSSADAGILILRPGPSWTTGRRPSAQAR